MLYHLWDRSFRSNWIITNCTAVYFGIRYPIFRSSWILESTCLFLNQVPNIQVELNPNKYMFISESSTQYSGRSWILISTCLFLNQVPNIQGELNPSKMRLFLTQVLNIQVELNPNKIRLFLNQVPNFRSSWILISTFISESGSKFSGRAES